MGSKTKMWIILLFIFEKNIFLQCTCTKPQTQLMVSYIMYHGLIQISPEGRISNHTSHGRCLRLVVSLQGATLCACMYRMCIFVKAEIFILQ